MTRPVRISVVLAAFNGEAWIGAQLRSWLDMLSVEDEVVVSDDASTDATLARVREFDDPRVRILASTERVGYQRNFERAIAAATGRFVLFSDQDDVCLPARVSATLAALQTRACVCGDARVVDAQLSTLSPSFFADRAALGFSTPALLARPAVIGATMGCRAEFLRRCLPFPAGVPHDQWLSVVAASCGELAVVREPFILYRRHAATASPTAQGGRGRPLGRILRERAALVRALLRWRRNRGLPTAAPTT